MSRPRERKEKICLNCKTELQGRYCHICGQENMEPKESVWHLISHFFKDITHFDGKFFSTLKYLIIKPGFLSKEYLIGRRASYVNPVRMYIFTSAFFFLIFFSLFKMDRKSIMTTTTVNKKTLTQVMAMDSAQFAQFTSVINKEDGKPATPMTRQEFENYFDSAMSGGSIHFSNTDFTSRPAYDSALRTGTVKHSWFRKQLIYKQIEINEKYKNDGARFASDFVNAILHSLPQMLFVFLPIFALMLKLLYIRRKEYYYVNHAIFSLHFYIFTFITLLVEFGINKLNKQLGWKVLDWLMFIIAIGIFFYLYKAMRRFYMQRRAKTIFKFFILFILFTVTLGLLLAAFVFYSLFKL
jgi:hypothetical protein